MEAFCQQSSSLLSPNKNKQIRIIKTASSSNKRIGGGRGGNLVTPLDNTYAYAAAAAGLLNPPSRANSLVHYQHQQQQPPLLPLPNASSIHNQHQHQHHQPLLSRSQSLMISSPKKSNKASTKKRSSSEHDNSSHRQGPDPEDLPKHLPLSKVLVMGGNNNKGNMEDMIMSPPPSSLPLPKFSLRSKLSCNAEAAGVDDGATNNLRRLLRLR